MLDSSKLETDPEVARRVPQGAVGDRRDPAGSGGRVFLVGGARPRAGRAPAPAALHGRVQAGRQAHNSLEEPQSE